MILTLTMSTLECYIQNMGGDVFTVSIHPTMTVNELKHYLCSTPNPFELRYECQIHFIIEDGNLENDGYTELLGDTLLTTYGVTHQTTLHIVIDCIIPGQLLRIYQREAYHIHSPYMVCFQHNKMFVSLSQGNQIQVMRKQDGALLRVYGSGRPTSHPTDFKNPKGICVANDELFVADTENHRIQVLQASTGAFLRSYGHKGTQPGEFSDVIYICLSPDNAELYIVDSCNHRIQVLCAATGKYLRMYGPERGEYAVLEKPTPFFYGIPQAVYVTETKIYIIADNKVYIVRISDGAHLEHFSVPHIIYPMGICVSNGIIFVSAIITRNVVAIRESTKEVLFMYDDESIVSESSSHIIKYHAEFHYPTGIAVIGDELYVVDTNSNCIQMFNIPPIAEEPIENIEY
jgi:ribosomal protein S26